MPAQASVDDNFTFVGGLNTEGGFFVTPKNSWVEGQNVVPQRDGSLERRPALVYENSAASLGDVSLEAVKNTATTIEMWDGVGGNGNRDWFVVQVGTIISFYQAYPIATSASTVGGSIDGTTMSALSFDLTPYRCFGNEGLISDKPISATPVYGNLLITHEDCEPIVVVWRENNALTVQKMKLQMRDFKGISSPLSDDQERAPSEWVTLNFRDEALYNLYNQGWKNTELSAYLTANGTWPSNTKQWFQGKDTNDEFQSSVLNKIDFGTSRAPRGRFILEAFYEDRGAATSTNSNLDSIGSSTGGADGSGFFNYDFLENDLQ